MSNPIEKSKQAVYCYQVNYMDKEIHKFELVEFTDKYVKFKWKQNKKWHSATVYHGNGNEVWFKTEQEALVFIDNDYSSYFKKDM